LRQQPVDELIVVVRPELERTELETELKITLMHLLTLLLLAAHLAESRHCFFSILDFDFHAWLLFLFLCLRGWYYAKSHSSIFN